MANRPWLVVGLLVCSWWVCGLRAPDGHGAATCGAPDLAEVRTCQGIEAEVVRNSLPTTVVPISPPSAGGT